MTFTLKNLFSFIWSNLSVILIWPCLCMSCFYEWTLSSPPHNDRYLFSFVFSLILGFLLLFQVGYESPHPHMRVPGLPASLQTAASGKPWVSSFIPAITQIFTCSLLTALRFPSNFNGNIRRKDVGKKQKENSLMKKLRTELTLLKSTIGAHALRVFREYCALRHRLAMRLPSLAPLYFVFLRIFLTSSDKGQM